MNQQTNKPVIPDCIYYRRGGLKLLIEPGSYGKLSNQRVTQITNDNIAEVQAKIDKATAAKRFLAANAIVKLPFEPIPPELFQAVIEQEIDQALQKSEGEFWSGRGKRPGQ